MGEEGLLTPIRCIRSTPYLAQAKRPCKRNPGTRALARRELQRIERRVSTFQDDLALSEQRSAVLHRFWDLLLTDLATRLAIKDQDAFASLSSFDARSDLAHVEKQLQQQSAAVLEALSKQSDVNVVEL